MAAYNRREIAAQIDAELSLLVTVVGIAPDARAQAARNFADGNLTAFLAAELLDPRRDAALDLVVRNAGALHARGLYERALVGAYRKGFSAAWWPGPTLQWLFAAGDAARVRTAGDPLPGPGPFEVYRGGRGAGLSWTSDPLIAAYFAEMHIDVAPTIRKALLPAADVYVYFAHFEHDRVTRSRVSRTIGLTWLSHRSDEFLAAADPGGVALEPAEVEALIARVRA